MTASSAPPPATAWHRLRGRWFWGAFALLLAVAIAPVLRAGLPPLFDYPNHLARMHVLLALPDSQALQRYYEIHWRPLPNLAMDLVVPALARWMPLAWAGKTFIAISFALVAGGAALLHRAAAGRWSLWPLFAFLFLYSRVLLWGFLNYLFGVGLALIAAAAWIALERRPAWLRIAVSAAFATALYFAHLMACAVYAIFVAGFELGRLWRERPLRLGAAAAQLATAAAPFLPAVALLLLAGGGGLGAVNFGRFVRKLDILFSVFDNYDRAFDVACFAVVVLAALFAYARRYLVVIPALRAPLLLLALAYLLAPAQLMGASAVDHRLPLVLAVGLAAATTAPALGLAALRWVAMAGAALFLIRIGVTEVFWDRADARYLRYLAILDQVPQGGRLAVAFPAGAINSDPVPKTHLPAMAIIGRDAFVPTLFVFSDQQPVAFTPAAAALAKSADPEALWRWATAGGNAAAAAPAPAVLKDFDALVVLDRQPFALPPSPSLAPVAAEPDFALLRVVH